MIVRAAWVTAAVALAACRFDPSGVGFTDDGGGARIDARPGTVDAAQGMVDARPGSPDARPDSPDANCAWDYDPLYYDPCSGAEPTPGPSLDLSATGIYYYDTDSGDLQPPFGPVLMPPSTVVGGARRILTSGFSLGSSSTLRVNGGRPLIIVSTNDATIGGTIDASSVWVNIPGFYAQGAGANPAACPASPPDPGATCAQHGGSGGGAGAFGGDGGAGGEGGDGHDCGDGVNTSGIPGGAGGVHLNTAPATIRGGCAGRDGAPNNAADLQGAGAPGGGAVHVAARANLTVSGIVHAGGAGGRPGGGSRAGAGGGGSGGMIGLEAASISIANGGVLAANGGGGGGGSEQSAATAGEDGKPSAAAAIGGPAQGNGSAGGDGSAAGTLAGASSTIASRGGGGGGGGAGFVVLYSPATPVVGTTAVISPAATIP